MFDAQLPVIHSKNLKPGQRSLLYNLNFIKSTEPFVIASAARVSDEEVNKKAFRFCLKGPKETMGRARIFSPKKPKHISIKKADNVKCGTFSDWENSHKTILINYPNQPKGVWVELHY